MAILGKVQSQSSYFVHFKQIRRYYILLRRHLISYFSLHFEPLKGICQDFENFVNVLWIRSLIHVDLICEKNFEIGFIVFEYSYFDFSAQIFLWKRFRKKQNSGVTTKCDDKVIQLLIGQAWAMLPFFYWRESNTVIAALSWAVFSWHMSTVF